MERFHKTVKDALYCLYSDDPDNFNTKESLEVIIKKYNNHVHSSTKYSPNQIFYSNDENLFNKVLTNIKLTFKSREKLETNFIENEKCLLNKKFKIKKFCKDKLVGILFYDKLKKKSLYGKINVTIINKVGTNYKIKIEKDYEDMNLFKNDLYMVEYKLLSKCSEKLWLDLLEKDDNSEKELLLNEILSRKPSFNNDELNFINEHKNEFK